MRISYIIQRELLLQRTTKLSDILMYLELLLILCIAALGKENYFVVFSLCHAL